MPRTTTTTTGTTTTASKPRCAAMLPTGRACPRWAEASYGGGPFCLQHQHEGPARCQGGPLDGTWIWRSPYLYAQVVDLITDEHNAGGFVLWVNHRLHVEPSRLLGQYHFTHDPPGEPAWRWEATTTTRVSRSGDTARHYRDGQHPHPANSQQVTGHAGPGIELRHNSISAQPLGRLNGSPRDHAGPGFKLPGNLKPHPNGTARDHAGMGLKLPGNFSPQPNGTALRTALPPYPAEGQCPPIPASKPEPRAPTALGQLGREVPGTYVDLGSAAGNLACYNAESWHQRIRNPRGSTPVVVPGGLQRRGRAYRPGNAKLPRRAPGQAGRSVHAVAGLWRLGRALRRGMV